MISQDLKKHNLPDGPGIYFFIRHKKDHVGGQETGKEILYIGKATSLRDRVSSYFNKDLIASRGPRIVTMVDQADLVDFIRTDSVLEALILEAQQIKKHQPPYNIREKDGKSFNYVVITKEAYPRVLTVRGKELAEDESWQDKIKYQFGPFPLGSELREAMKIIRRIFPFRTKCIPAEFELKAGRQPKPCFDAQLGLCPGICAGTMDKEDYRDLIQNIRLFFEGKKRTVLRNLDREMTELAKEQEFEKARLIRNKIFALNHIQDVALIKQRNYNKENPSEELSRIEAYDVAHISGTNTVGVMTVLVDGEPLKSEYRKFKLKGETKNEANDTANLAEILERRLAHDEWPLPDLIVVDGSQAQLRTAEKVLKNNHLEIPVVGVVKDEHHRPKKIIGPKDLIKDHEQNILVINSEAHRFAISYHRQLRGRML